jgi:hypothetical protein
MKPIDPDATLVQVLYDPRLGILAFFSDGSVAEAKTSPSGRRTWHVRENILTETDINAQDPADPIFAEVAD